MKQSALDELARIERIIKPASLYLAEARARELIAVSSGDLESAEQYHKLHQIAVKRLEALLNQWRSAKRFPLAQRYLRKLLANCI